MLHVERDVVEYLSVNNVVDTKQVTSYPIEFLNSLELSGVKAESWCSGPVNEKSGSIKAM
jgi:hypothetical protein